MNEKIKRMFIRTTEHIHRVQNNMLLLVTKYSNYLQLTEDECRELMFNVFKHDQSKFSEKQFLPYVELTEYYYQKTKLNNKEYDYQLGVKELVKDAIIDHYKIENHHPERFENSLGKYSKLEAIETICDLQAMSQEYNETSCRNYFENVWKKKQSKYFYDDFNWIETVKWMLLTIECFELEIKNENRN